MRLIAGCFALCALFCQTQALAVTIEGYVRNREGAFQERTEVTAFAFVRGSLVLVGSDFTHDNPDTAETDPGFYRLDIRTPGVAVVASVRYDNHAWQPRLIRDLTGELAGGAPIKHVINKVLLDKRGPLTFLQILEQIHEYEQLFYLQMMLDKGLKSTEQTKLELRNRFKDRICSMPDPRRVLFQPAEQQAIIKNLKQADSSKLPILSKKLHDLFELYGIGNPASSVVSAYQFGQTQTSCWQPVSHGSRCRSFSCFRR